MQISKLYHAIFLVAGAFLLHSCDSSDLVSDKSEEVNTDQLSLQQAKKGTDGVAITSEFLGEINQALAGTDANYRIIKAEYITSAGSHEVGATILAKDVGNKQLNFDFVPHDLRRIPWSGPVDEITDDIIYAVDTNPAQVSNLPAPVAEAAIDRAMNTWDVETCSDLPIVKSPLPPGIDLGPTLGGLVAGDINHAGWVGIAPPILGITITWVFCAPCAPNAVITDIDGNGKGDTAFREIFYNSNYIWADDGVSNIDVESVALHEAGHGLSQAHFGTVMIKNNGDLKRAPVAVMNALYSEPMRELLGTDEGGHCSNWAQWPNN